MIEPGTHKWHVCITIAREKYDVTKHAIAQWRVRGIPHKFHIPLIRDSDGAITMEDFIEE
jgi:hypothetical protein